MNTGRHWLALLCAFIGFAALPARAERPEDNLFLLEKGARIEAFSSEFGSGWEAANLTPARSDFDAEGAPQRPLVWSSASMAPFPHWILFRFEKPIWFTGFVFDNFLAEEADHPGISAREIELWTGDAPDALTRVASFRLARNAAGQRVKVEPVQARYVRLVVLSNYGHPWYTELGATQAFDDGSRPGDLAAALLKDGAIDLYGLYFDFGSAVLRAESAPVLERIMAFLKAHSAERLAIEGHTDAVGGDAANLALSEARATAVRAALIQRGAAQDRLAARGFGEAQPVAGNDSDAGRAANRRVTLRRLDVKE